MSKITLGLATGAKCRIWGSDRGLVSRWEWRLGLVFSWGGDRGWNRNGWRQGLVFANVRSVRAGFAAEGSG